MIKKVIISGVLLIICFLAFWLRVPYLRVPVLLVDEALYGEIANVILDGGVPYKDAWEQKPPAIYYFYALIFAIFGRNNLIAVHWVAAMTICGTCLGLLFIGKRLGDIWLGLLSACGYAILASAGNASHFQAANTEIFAVACAVWGIGICLMDTRRFAKYCISGILIAVATFFKQPAGLCFIVTGAYLFLKDGSLSVTKDKLREIALIIAGMLATVLFVIGYFWYRDALYDFWIIGYWHNVLYMEGNDIRHGIHVALKNIPLFTTANKIFYIPATLLCFINFYRVIQRYIRSHQILLKEVVLITWLVVGWVSTGLGWRFEGHYFYFVLPAVAVLSADFFVQAIKLALRWKRYGVIAAIFIGLIYLYGAGYSIIYYSGFPPGRERMFRVLMDPKNRSGLVIKTVAQYVERHTDKKDTIFVWGFCPEIYTLSNRRCASRFIFCNFLIGQMTGDKYYYGDIERLDRTFPGSWEKLMEDLYKKFPKYIIDISPTNYFKYGPYPVSRFYMLRDFLDKFYRYEGRMIDIDLYKLDPSKVEMLHSAQ